jgi:hypothetical protein
MWPAPLGLHLATRLGYAARATQFQVVSWCTALIATSNKLRLAVRQIDMSTAYQMQGAILCFLAVLFSAYGILVLHSPLFVSASLVASCVAASAGYVFGSRALGRLEVMAALAAVILGSALYLPRLLPAPRDAGVRALASLGSFIIVGAWAIHRFAPSRRLDRESLLGSLRENALLGVAVASVYAILAALVFGIASLTFGDDPDLSWRSFGLVVAGYFSAGTAAGVLFAFLRPLSRWPLGRMCLGIPITALVLGIFGLVFPLTGEPETPSTFGQIAEVAVRGGLFLGPISGLVFGEEQL